MFHKPSSSVVGRSIRPAKSPFAARDWSRRIDGERSGPNAGPLRQPRIRVGVRSTGPSDAAQATCAATASGPRSRRRPFISTSTSGKIRSPPARERVATRPIADASTRAPPAGTGAATWATKSGQVSSTRWERGQSSSPGRQDPVSGSRCRDTASPSEVFTAPETLRPIRRSRPPPARPRAPPVRATPKCRVVEPSSEVNVASARVSVSCRQVTRPPGPGRRVAPASVALGQSSKAGRSLTLRISRPPHSVRRNGGAERTTCSQSGGSASLSVGDISSGKLTKSATSGRASVRDVGRADSSPHALTDRVIVASLRPRRTRLKLRRGLTSTRAPPQTPRPSPDPPGTSGLDGGASGRDPPSGAR